MVAVFDKTLMWCWASPAMCWYLTRLEEISLVKGGGNPSGVRPGWEQLVQLA